MLILPFHWLLYTTISIQWIVVHNPVEKFPISACHMYSLSVCVCVSCAFFVVSISILFLRIVRSVCCTFSTIDVHYLMIFILLPSSSDSIYLALCGAIVVVHVWPIQPICFVYIFNRGRCTVLVCHSFIFSKRLLSDFLLHLNYIILCNALHSAPVYQCKHCTSYNRFIFRWRIWAGKKGKMSRWKCSKRATQHHTGVT